MRYTPPVTAYQIVPKRGDVWIITINEFGGCRGTRAVIISVSADKVTFKRLMRECNSPECHLLSDPASAGLDYAEYLNDVPESSHFNGLVRRIGCLSREDRAFI